MQIALFLVFEVCLVIIYFESFVEWNIFTAFRIFIFLLRILELIIVLKSKSWILFLVSSIKSNSAFNKIVFLI
jgi:hypothetical protein